MCKLRPYLFEIRKLEVDGIPFADVLIMLTLLKLVEIILVIRVEPFNIPLTASVKDLDQLGIKVDDMLLEGKVFSLGVIFLELRELITC